MNSLERITNILADNDYNNGGMMRWHPSGEPTEKAHLVAKRIQTEVVDYYISQFEKIRAAVDEWEISGDDNVLVNVGIDPVLVAVLGRVK